MPDQTPNVPLAPLTTLQLGGTAERLVRAESGADLAHLVVAADQGIEPVFLLGGGSNVVIADHGVPGTTIQIATRGIEARAGRDGQVELTVQAGEPWDDVVAYAVDNELTGIECLSGVPGSTGATPIQNVGAYGQEVASTISTVEVLDRISGEVRQMTAGECGFGYRTSRFKGRDDFVVLAVTFILDRSTESASITYAQLAEALEVDPGTRAPLARVREAVLNLRRNKSMVIDPADPESVSAGSFFTNPVLSGAEAAYLMQQVDKRLGPGVNPPNWPAGEGQVKFSAAWLIEQAGFSKGYGSGPVGLSRNHSLALVNRGGASTTDLVVLAREIAAGVEATFGVQLVPEPVFIGHTWSGSGH